MYLREPVIPSTCNAKFFKRSDRMALTGCPEVISGRGGGCRYNPVMKYLPLIVMCVACLSLSGCDEYEREKLENAADNVGDASSHAADRARTGTANGLQDLSDSIRPDEDAQEQPATDADRD